MRGRAVIRPRCGGSGHASPTRPAASWRVGPACTPPATSARRATRLRKPIRPTSVDLYNRLLDLCILPTLGDLALVDITPAITRRWYDGLPAKNPTQNGNAYALLRSPKPRSRPPRSSRCGAEHNPEARYRQQPPRFPDRERGGFRRFWGGGARGASLAQHSAAHERTFVGHRPAGLGSKRGAASRSSTDARLTPPGTECSLPASINWWTRTRDTPRILLAAVGVTACSAS